MSVHIIWLDYIHMLKPILGKLSIQFILILIIWPKQVARYYTGLYWCYVSSCRNAGRGGCRYSVDITRHVMTIVCNNSAWHMWLQCSRCKETIVCIVLNHNEHCVVCSCAVQLIMTQLPATLMSANKPCRQPCYFTMIPTAAVSVNNVKHWVHKVRKTIHQYLVVCYCCDFITRYYTSFLQLSDRLDGASRLPPHSNNQLIEEEQ